MSIKVILVDIDGTLLTNNNDVSPLTRQAIKDVRKQGVVFGIATGRDVPSVRRMIKIWDIEDSVDVIVGMGGAEIYHADRENVDHYFPLNGQDTIEIISHFKDMNVNFAIPYNGIFLTPKESFLIKMLAFGNQTSYQVIDYDEYLMTHDPAKLIIICESHLMDDVRARSETFAIDQVRSYPTASILYEYMDARVSKSFGIQKALDHYGFTQDELCCFGDADNDYEMIRDAGIGVVMGNGSDYTKSVADYITDDNDHDGIAQFIYDYILK